MRTSGHSSRDSRGQQGFTLLEVSAAISVALGLSLALVSLLQQHVTFMRLFQRQTFLVREAPAVGDLLGRMLGGADAFFVYPTREAALAGGQPVAGNGQAAGLFTNSPAGETVTRVLAGEPAQNGAVALRCYTAQPGGGVSAWTVSDRIAGVEFRMEQGILGVTLHGPNGEEITYWGGAR